MRVRRPRMWRTRSAPDAGFTLLEILMVVLLVGIFTTVALMSVQLGGESRLLDDELRRIDRLVSLARDETNMRMVDLGLGFAADGYRFVSWDGQDWHDLVDPGPFRRRSWPPAVSTHLVVDGLPAELPAALPDDDLTPQVMILSSGEVTPFALRLRTDTGHEGTLSVIATGDSERGR